jgi:hypothetical protein
MDSRTGELYPTREAAVEAGVPEEDVVEVKGPPPAVHRVAKAVSRDARRKAARLRRMQKASRKANRR